MSNPYEPTSVNVDAPIVTDAHIEQVRLGQRMVLGAFVLNLAVGALGSVHPALVLLGWLAALIIGVWGLARIARGLGWGWGLTILCLILMLIPLVNLITLLALNGKATARLREAGYQVGLLGARPAKS